MRKLLFIFSAALLLACSSSQQSQPTAGFVTIQGHDLIKPNGEKLFIQGTNLGNWLNPEGYMFDATKEAISHYINFRDSINRPDQQTFRRLLKEFAENTRFDRCKPQTDYIATMGLKE